MTDQFKLSSEFPFAADKGLSPKEFAYLGPHDMLVLVEAPTRQAAREIGLNIAENWQSGYPAAQASVLRHINQANERQEPLSLTIKPALDLDNRKAEDFYYLAGPGSYPF